MGVPGNHCQVQHGVCCPTSTQPSLSWVNYMSKIRSRHIAASRPWSPGLKRTKRAGRDDQSINSGFFFFPICCGQMNFYQGESSPSREGLNNLYKMPKHTGVFRMHPSSSEHLEKELRVSSSTLSETDVLPSSNNNKDARSTNLKDSLEKEMGKPNYIPV